MKFIKSIKVRKESIHHIEVNQAKNNHSNRRQANTRTKNITKDNEFYILMMNQSGYQDFTHPTELKNMRSQT